MSGTKIRTGGCACGAVRYEATGGDEYGACHCGTCRRWVGGPFLAADMETLTVTQGADKVHVWNSSDWAERAGCAVCGSALWYRIKAWAPGGQHVVSVGTLDDLSDMKLTGEIFTDSKAVAIPFLSESSRKMTEAEAIAAFNQASGA